MTQVATETIPIIAPIVLLLLFPLLVSTRDCTELFLATNQTRPRRGPLRGRGLGWHQRSCHKPLVHVTRCNHFKPSCKARSHLILKHVQACRFLARFQREHDALPNPPVLIRPIPAILCQLVAQSKYLLLTCSPRYRCCAHHQNQYHPREQCPLGIRYPRHKRSAYLKVAHAK